MKLIKKSEKLLQETKITEEIKEPNLQTDTIDSINLEEWTVEEQSKPGTEHREPNYIPMRDNPVVLSVGKTGWQISDIWKDIRLDNF